MSRLRPSRPARTALLLAALAATAPVVAGREAAAQSAADTVELPALEVTAASRLPEGGRLRAAQVLDRAALDRLPVRTVQEALRWAVGADVQPRSPAQADLSLRGSTFEQVLVLVDGVPMSDAQTGHFDLDLTVPLEMVERIEVVRGPASSLYGADAVGGVVNVVTRTGSGAARGAVTLEAGSWGAAAASMVTFLPLGGGWRMAASVERDQADGHRDGVDHAATLAHATLSGPVAGGRLRVGGGWAARDFGADGFYAPFPSYEETRSRLLSAGWRGPVGRTDVEVRAFGREHDDDFVLRRGDPAFYRNVHQARQGGVEATLRAGSARGVSAAVGAEWIRDDLESTNLGDRTEDRGGLYVEGGWSGPAAGVRGGVRLEGRDGFGSWVAPSLSASVDLASGLRLRGGVGRSYRTPTFTERYYTDPANVGRADLDPESAWTVEGGLDWVAGPALVRATLYRRVAEELIDWARPVGAPTGTPWETRNVESATVTGVELAVEEVRLGPAALEAAASLLALDTEEAQGFESKVALRPLTRDLLVGVRLPLGDRASAAFRVRALRRTGGDAYELGALRLTGRVGPAELRLDLTNLWNAEYLDITGLPAPGRAVRSGVRIPLG